MSADSGGKSEWEFKWEADQRKEFQEDPAMWLHARHAQTGKWISDQAERQIKESKSLAQRAAELSENGLVATRESVILYVAIIAILALASARLWIGVVAVMLVLVLRRWLVWSAQKQDFRLARFRDRFRRLLVEADSVFAEMLAEDKEFLRKYEDSILYPLAVPEHERELPGMGELEHIETLYREYCYSPDHHHVGGPGYLAPLEKQQKHLETCSLCKTAKHVRDHIEGVVSRFENEIAQWREGLVTQIDGVNPEGAIPAREFMEDFRSWCGPFSGEAALQAPIEWLRDKEKWTFDHADKVRGACREGQEWESRNDYASRTFDKLSLEMEKAATHCGLGEEWRHYDTLMRGIWDKRLQAAVKEVRRIIRRKNPEVLFREFTDDGYSRLVWINMELESLRNYGYNRDLVEREVLASQKFLAKEGWKMDKCYRKELDAAKSFAWLEKAIKEQHYKEVPWGARPEPLTFRFGKAIGKLLGRHS